MHVFLTFPDNDPKLQESWSRMVRCRGSKDWGWEKGRQIAGTRRSCISLLRSTVSYILFVGGDWAKISRDLCQTMLQNNTVYPWYSCLRTDKPSLSAEKAGFSGTQTPWRSMFQLHTGSCQVCPLGKDTELTFPFSFNWDLRERLELIWLPTG